VVHLKKHDRKSLEYMTYAKTVHVSLVVVPRFSLLGLNFKGDEQTGAKSEDGGSYPKSYQPRGQWCDDTSNGSTETGSCEAKVTHCSKEIISPKLYRTPNSSILPLQSPLVSESQRG
jgi:hypothetical protein